MSREWVDTTYTSLRPQSPGTLSSGFRPGRIALVPVILPVSFDNIARLWAISAQTVQLLLLKLDYSTYPELILTFNVCMSV